MKKFFTKAIVGFLMFNTTLMLSGFCIFQLLNIPHTTYADEIQDETTINKVLPDGVFCGENAKPKMSPVEGFSSLQIVQGTDGNHTMLLCCIDGGYDFEMAGTSQSKAETVKNVSAVFFPPVKIPAISLSFPKLYSKICVPSHISAIRTTVLRL